MAGLAVCVACSRADSRAAEVIVTLESAPIVHNPRPAWSEASAMKHPPVRLAPGVANVVVHIPANFDAAKRLELVVLFHASFMCAAQLAMVGDIVCRPGAKPQVGGGIAYRHDDAETNSVFVVPQMNLWGGGTAGEFATPGYFETFVREVIEDIVSRGVGANVPLDELEGITLVSHSAGYLPLEATLARPGALDEKVRRVVALDALFNSSPAPYVAWLTRHAGDSRTKFVAVSGKWGKNATVARAITQRANSRSLDPTIPLSDAVRDHIATAKTWQLEHVWLLPLVLSKVLRGFEMPARAALPSATPVGPATEALRIAPGSSTPAKFAADNAHLANGALYRDFVVALDAGTHRVHVRPERSETEPCCELDTLVQVFHDNRLAAANDDDGAGFGSSASFSLASPAETKIRVTTSGSGEKRGAFRVEVDRERGP